MLYIKYPTALCVTVRYTYHTSHALHGGGLAASFTRSAFTSAVILATLFRYLERKRWPKNGIIGKEAHSSLGRVYSAKVMPTAIAEGSPVPLSAVQAQRGEAKMWLV